MRFDFYPDFYFIALILRALSMKMGDVWEAGIGLTANNTNDLQPRGSSLLFSYPIILSGDRPFSVPLLILYDVMRVVIRCWWLYERRVNVAGKWIRRVKWIVAVGLCRAVVYGSLTVLSCVQMIFSRWLLVSFPIVGDASIPGWLFLERYGYIFNLIFIVKDKYTYLNRYDKYAYLKRIYKNY